MLGTALLVFRETLEAALLIGIIAAATRGVMARNRWIMIGIAAGILGAGLVALLTGEIAKLADGIGPDLVNAAILVVAIAMLAWHTIWMSSHGKELAGEAGKLGRDIQSGSVAMSAACVAIAMTVLREGAETVLFLYGVMSGSEIPLSQAWAGGLLGLLAGVAIGFVAYAGIVRIPMRHVFNVTTGLIILLAASMASQLARILGQADLLPAGTAALWDSSSVLPMDSALGNVLHALVGYDAKPSAMQLLFYMGVIALMLIARHWVTKRAMTQAALS